LTNKGTEGREKKVKNGRQRKGTSKTTAWKKCHPEALDSGKNIQPKKDQKGAIQGGSQLVQKGWKSSGETRGGNRSNEEIRAEKNPWQTRKGH